jgi:hypothetical protein
MRRAFGGALAGLALVLAVTIGGIVARYGLETTAHGGVLVLMLLTVVCSAIAAAALAR